MQEKAGGYQEDCHLETTDHLYHHVEEVNRVFVLHNVIISQFRFDSNLKFSMINT